MSDDDEIVHDDPVLSDEAATEVMALVRTAMGDRLTDESPFTGDAMSMIELTLGHTIGDYYVWLENTTINVSLCAHCGSVSVCAIAPVASFIHGCVEVMERLRDREALGGDADDMVCTYRRMPVDGSFPHAYVFAGHYWLDFDDVADRVIHTTRSMVVVLDEITGLIQAIEENRRNRN